MTRFPETKKGRSILARTQRAELRFTRGWGDVVGAEAAELLRDLSTPPKLVPQLTTDPTSVFLTKVDLRTICELTLRLKTAHDLVWWIDSARVPHRAALERALEQTPWELYFDPGAALKVRALSRRSVLYHTGMITEVAAGVLTAKGYAVTDRDDAEQLVELRVIGDRLDIGISCGFPSLAHRGYKVALAHRAPLREDLAACLIRWLLSGRQVSGGRAGITHCYVPFAGSGTLAIEAILEIERFAPCLFPRVFPVERLACTPEKSHHHVRNRSAAQVGSTAPLALTCIDSDDEVCGGLRRNIEGALRIITGAESPPAARTVTIEQADFFGYRLEMVPESAGCICVLLNPPFGERLTAGGDAASFYRRLGKALRGQLGTRPHCGMILAPTADAASGFVQSLEPSRVDDRPIRHGGKPLIAVRWYSERDEGEDVQW